MSNQKKQTVSAPFRIQNAELTQRYQAELDAWRQQGPIAQMREQMRGPDGNVMSQRNFAQLVGYALQTVGNWERGVSRVTTASMKEIVMRVSVGLEPTEPVTMTPDELAAWREQVYAPWKRRRDEAAARLQEQFERWWEQKPPSPPYSFPELLGVADDGDPVGSVA